MCNSTFVFVVHIFRIILFLSYLQPREEFHQSIPLTNHKIKRISFKDEVDKFPRQDYTRQHAPAPEVHKNTVSLNRAAASEYTPKVHIIADYAM